MRADRLLSIIWLLRAHGGLSAADLAERLEVSRRTILRDVEALSASGVPVFSERGPRGGIRLMPGYRMDVTALSREESQALFAGLAQWGAESLDLRDAFASGVRKLLAAVPEAHREESSQMAQRVVIDPQGWLPQPERARIGETFRIIQEAVFAQRRLRIEYRSKGRASARGDDVEPHGLVSAGPSWYLCASLQGKVVFKKLARVDRAVVLDEPCDPGSRVDVGAAWTAQRERFLGRFVAVNATVWVRETRWSDVQDSAIRIGEAEPESEPPPGDGWRLLELEFVDDLHAMTALLRLGGDAVVVTPKDLREALVAYLTEALSRY